MKLNSFWKGLIMALVGFIATAISDVGTTNWAYVWITTAAFTIIYVGKNAVFPSVSIGNKFDLRDILSGVIVAIGMAVSSVTASVLTTGTIEFQALWIAVSGAVIGYFIKTLPQSAE